MFKKKSSRKDEFATLGLTVPDGKDSDAGESDGDLEKELMELLKDSGDADVVQSDSDAGSNDEDLLAELEAFCSEDKAAQKSSSSSSSSKQPEKTTGPSSTPNYLSIQQVKGQRAMYESAIEALLDSSSPDGSKLESFTEAVDKLNELESRIKNGESIRVDQLPPAPDLNSQSPARQPPQPAPTMTPKVANPPVQPKISAPKQPEPKQPDGRQMVLDYINPQVSQDSGMIALKKRLQEYKLAALQARDAGQVERGKQLLMASKCISEAIQKIEAGEETFDPSTDMPPPPSEFEATSDDGDEEPQPANASESDLTKQFAAMATPVVSVDNLTQRMAYFQNMVNELQKDSSADAKRRRMGRIVKQYQEALVACKQGVSAYGYSELPTPPGCPQLTDLSQLAPAANRKPAGAAGTAAGGAAAASSSRPTSTAKPDAAALLTKRQTELRVAAARAKQAGNIEQAKRYLIAARGMAPMIQAAAAGMPINKSQIPPAPHVDAPGAAGGQSFTIFTGQKCDPPVEYLELMATNPSSKILLKILEAQEKEACELLSQHQKSTERRFISGLYELAKSVSADKNNLMHGIKSTYYFELVNLPRMNMNVDLGEDILDIASVRGIDYPLPSGVSSTDHLDTYMELQLSYPSTSEPTKLTSEWVKHSNQPVYVFQNTKIPVNFKSRLYRQIVQSNRGLKATIYYKRGLLKSYGVLGTAIIPLNGLVNSATVTHVGNLMTGYRASGGQLEVKLRQRSSLLGESTTYIQKPWLRLKYPKPAEPQTVNSSASNSHRSPRPQIEIIRPTPGSPSRSPQYHHSGR